MSSDALWMLDVVGWRTLLFEDVTITYTFDTRGHVFLVGIFRMYTRGTRASCVPCSDLHTRKHFHSFVRTRTRTHCFLRDV